MYVFYKTGEFHLSDVKPNLDDSYDYYYAATSISEDEVLTSSFDSATNTLMLNGVSCPATLMDKNNISVNSNDLSVVDNFVITSEKSDTLKVVPLRNPDLAEKIISVNAGTNTFNISTKGYFIISSQDKISEILFLKVSLALSPPSGNYISSV